MGIVNAGTKEAGRATYGKNKTRDGTSDVPTDT